MKTPRIIAVAVLIVASSLTLHVALSTSIFQTTPVPS